MGQKDIVSKRILRRLLLDLAIYLLRLDLIDAELLATWPIRASGRWCWRFWATLVTQTRKRW